jgi:hypothetical protein
MALRCSNFGGRILAPSWCIVSWNLRFLLEYSQKCVEGFGKMIGFAAGGSAVADGDAEEAIDCQTMEKRQEEIKI